MVRRKKSRDHFPLPKIMSITHNQLRDTKFQALSVFSLVSKVDSLIFLLVCLSCKTCEPINKLLVLKFCIMEDFWCNKITRLTLCLIKIPQFVPYDSDRSGSHEMMICTLEENCFSELRKGLGFSKRIE